MFGFLKDKLKKSVVRLADKVRGEDEMPEKLEKKPAPAKAKPKAKPAKAIKPGKPAKSAGKPKKRHEEISIEETKAKEPEPLPEPLPEPAHEPQHEPEPVPEHEPELAAPEAEEAAPAEEGKKPGFFGRLLGIKETVVEKTLTDKDIDSFFAETEHDLLQANIAVEAVEHMRGTMKKELANKKIKRRGAEQFITKALEDSLFDLVNQGSLDMEKIIKDAKKQGRAACFIFLGFNGSGKTTSIAKVGRYLLDKGHSVVLAAGDTFRAASIEQIEHHAKKLGVNVIKHQYGSDSAAVIFDARKHADSKGIDVVLADTAGRTHVDKNLMEELKKVIRVNKPDLKILVVDSLTGNDAVDQAKTYHEAVGVDCVIMAKADVYEKGGSILSVSYAIKKPILFLGTGQEYGDLEKFEPGKFVKELME